MVQKGTFPTAASLPGASSTVDPSKRPAPGFAVSGDGGVYPRALRPSHRAYRPSCMGRVGAMADRARGSR
eukprot:26986-Prymnesium_polylepis.1